MLNRKQYVLYYDNPSDVRSIKYGVPQGSILDPLLFLIYMMLNRKQCVLYYDNPSDVRSIKCGVPQGSILGPLLFLIYVNDCSNVSDMLLTIMFADDTNMFVNGENLNTLETQLNSELKHVSTWWQVNKWSLNVDKSCFIVFKAVKKSDLEVNVCIKDKRLSRVSQVKFLGTIIDENWHGNLISTTYLRNYRKQLLSCIG